MAVFPKRSMNDRGDANLEAHRRKPQCFDTQLRPDRRMVRHVLTVQPDDRFIDDRREATHMVCIDVNDVAPACTGLRQNPFDIPKCGGDFFLDRLGHYEIVVPAALAGVGGLLPGGMGLPSAGVGWVALACLVLLYGTAFSTLFIFVTRLNIARNAPVMNMEPVAGLLFGWLILDQLLGGIQIIGGLIVVSGIVLLTYRRPA